MKYLPLIFALASVAIAARVWWLTRRDARRRNDAELLGS